MRKTVLASVALTLGMHAAPASASGACRILTRSYVETVMKMRVASTKPLGPQAGCQYMLVHRGIAPLAVALQMQPASRGDYDQYLRTTKTDLGVSTVRVKGIGEEAAWGGGRVFVYAKNQLWIFTGALFGVAEKDQRAKLIELAKRSLARV
jgi:hypothetical protein